MPLRQVELRGSLLRCPFAVASVEILIRVCSPQPSAVFSYGLNRFLICFAAGSQFKAHIVSAGTDKLTAHDGPLTF